MPNLGNESYAAIVVGYTLSLRSDALEGVQMEDFGAETEKTNAKRREKFQQKAHEVKLLGHVERVVAADLTQRRVLDTAKLSYGTDAGQFINPAQAFAKWVLEAHEDKLRTLPFGPNRVLFYGIDPKPLFRVLGPECNVDADYPIPLGLWYGVDALDPLEMLVESEYRLQVSLEKILARGKLRLREGYQPHTNAAVDCTLAAEIVLRFGLAPSHLNCDVGELSVEG